MEERCVVGVDLGGTNVRAQVFDGNGEPCSARVETESRAKQGVEECLDAVADAIEATIRSSKITPRCIGIAIPGHVDDAEGIVRWAPNFGQERDGVFYYWEDVPFREPLANRINLPMRLGNDANLAALGEYYFGSGQRSARCLVMVTLGTGVGGGVVLSPNSVEGSATGPLLLVGGNKGGGELGHVVIQANGLDSTSGAFGSLEAYCNRDALVRRAVNRLTRGVDSVVAHRVAGDWARVSPRLLSEAAEAGDPLALQTWAEFGFFLGIGIGSFVNIFAPDIVAVGGQIANAWPYFSQSTLTSARDTAVPSLWKDVDVRRAEQLDDAGILGAAALAMESSLWNS